MSASTLGGLYTIDELSSDASDSEDEADPLDPFNVQGLSLKDATPKAGDYLKVESMVGDAKFNVLVTPGFTVKDVIEKLSKRVDTRYKFFELFQVYDTEHPHKLHSDTLISSIINSRKGIPDKYRILFNYQDYFAVQIESKMDSHKWRIKLGPDATVAQVCEKLANKVDSKYNEFELYLVSDTKKILLERNAKIFEIISSQSPDTKQGGQKSALVFNYFVKGTNHERRPSSDKVPTHRSAIEEEKSWTDLLTRRQSSRRGIGLPKFKAPPKNPGELLARNKFSSTSTLFLANTMSKPDIDELLHCMAKALIFHVEKGSKVSDKTYFEIFDERLLPLSKEIIDYGCIPSEVKVYKFVKSIYDFGRLDPECVIMALAYIEKLLSLTQLTLDTTNWRRVSFIALAVALKTWEDFAVYNTEFLGVFNKTLTIKELNILEMHFLTLIEFNVYLPASLYAKYYFELKAYSQVDEAHFPLKPLDKEKAKLLELRTQSSQNLAKDLIHTVSLDRLQPQRVKAAIIG